MIIKILDDLPQDIRETTLKALAEGRVISFPTETVYALACDATKEAAIDKIYEIKKRNREQVFAILVSSVNELEKYAEVDGRVYKLLKRFSPGPITYVLQAKSATSICSKLIKDGKIGIRIPDHKIAQEILKNYPHPIAATSVNLSGVPDALQVSDIDGELKKQIDLILDGGKCRLGIGSTVVDLSAKDQVQILREGAISEKQMLSIPSPLVGEGGASAPDEGYKK